MSTPGQFDEGNIADTGMFKRFVEHEEELDQAAPRNASKLWLTIGAIVVIAVIAVVVYLLAR